MCAAGAEGGVIWLPMTDKPQQVKPQGLGTCFSWTWKRLWAGGGCLLEYLLTAGREYRETPLWSFICEE